MLRTTLAVIAAFFAWLILWFAGETILSAISPEGFGVPQRAFQEALEKGGPFAAPTPFLITHILLAAIVSTVSGFLAALIAGKSSRAPVILAFLLLALGLLKAVLSWPYVPVWYHVAFTAALAPLTILGGKLIPRKQFPTNSSSHS